MRNTIVTSFAAGVVLVLTAGAAFAGAVTVPEPMSLSLFAAGIGALAVVRYLRKK